MNYRTPKALEKEPIIAGQDLKSIVVIASCFLLFLFTVFTSFLLAFLCLCVPVIYLKIKKTFPNKGQLKIFIKYKTSIQCVRANKSIKDLIKK
jgi:hypothetical protein